MARKRSRKRSRVSGVVAGCQIITVSRVRKCHCNGRLAPNTKCGLPERGAYGHQSRTCKTYPRKLKNGRWQCKTWGGGVRFVAEKRVPYTKARIKREKMIG